MFISATLVSTSFTVGEAIANEIDPVILTFIRFFLAALILTPYVWYFFGIRFHSGLIFRCAIISGCLVIFFWCMFLALRYTSALNTSVIFTLVPAIAGIYAFILLKERMSRGVFFALVCGMAGALWVIFKGDAQLLLQMRLNKGDMIFFAGCLCMGLYTIFIRLFHRGEPMIVMTFWILVTGTLWLVLAGVYDNSADRLGQY